MPTLDDYMTKTNAISRIGLQTKFGRPIIEKTMKRLQDEGRITPVTYPHTILYSPEDIETVIKVLKGEIE